jgi:TPR repeat protein
LLLRSAPSVEFDFRPEDSRHVNWQKAAQQYAFVETRLIPPFNRLFIKRWEGRPADGHNLLVQQLVRQIPGTPEFYGYTSSPVGGGRIDHFYAFRDIHGQYGLLSDLIDEQDRKQSSNLVDGFPNGLAFARLIPSLVQQAARTLMFVSSRDFVFVDFDHKNIMRKLDFPKNAEGPGDGIRFIDLDSAWPISRVTWQNLIQRPVFSHVFWTLWYHLYEGDRDQARPAPATFIHPTMLLSLGAVWLRAAAILQAGKPGECWTLLSAPVQTKQEPLWRSLRERNHSEFSAFFQVPRHLTDGLFSRWCSIYGELTARHNVHIHRIAKLLTDTTDVFVAIEPTEALSRPSFQIVADRRDEYENLETVIRSLRTGSASTTESGLDQSSIQRRVVKDLIRQLAEAMYEMDRRRQVLVELSNRHLLIRKSLDGVAPSIIVAGDAPTMPIAGLRRQDLERRGVNMGWLGLWYRRGVENPNDDKPELIHPTLLLGIAATWLRAFGLLQRGKQHGVQSWGVISSHGASLKEFWSSLGNPDGWKDFRSYLCLGPHAKRVFRDWRAVAKAVEEGTATTSVVQQTVDATVDCVIPDPIVKTSYRQGARLGAVFGVIGGLIIGSGGVAMVGLTLLEHQRIEAAAAAAAVKAEAQRKAELERQRIEAEQAAKAEAQREEAAERQRIETEQREVEQILAPSEEKAKEVEAALAAGMDWREVATTIAEMDPDTIDLGLLKRDELPSALANVVFELPLNKPSEPVKTALGWHILRVVKIEPLVAQPFDQATPEAQPNAQTERQQIEAEAAGAYQAGDEAYQRQDYAEALRWFRKAADQGNADAQFNIGMMYENGEGVTQDYAEALRWYQKAADQENADAQNHIGLIYVNGWGVAQDYAEAGRWFRKAADQGNATAQYNLGLLYAGGKLGSRYKREGRLWMQKSAAGGNEDAKKWVAAH